MKKLLTLAGLFVGLTTFGMSSNARADDDDDDRWRRGRGNFSYRWKKGPDYYYGFPGYRGYRSFGEYPLYGWPRYRGGFVEVYPPYVHPYPAYRGRVIIGPPNFRWDDDWDDDD